MLTAEEITKKLEDYTAKNSRYELSRNYISLSHSVLSVQELVEQYRAGFQDGVERRLKCYKGYQMEDDLRDRLIRAFPPFCVTPGNEIQAYGGIVKGHPDFRFDGCPGDCKSVLMDEWIPNGRLPRRVYWQMQGYMLYSKSPQALVVYESREGGKLKAIWVYPNHAIQGEIDRKMQDVIAIVKGVQCED